MWTKELKRKIFQKIETCERASPRNEEYTEFSEVLIYIKPHILKGLEFHAKEFRFILQVVENWKIFEMRKGHYEPTCDSERKY